MTNEAVTEGRNREVEVKRTYVQMLSPDELSAFAVNDDRVRVERTNVCPASFYRYLYREVGRNYHWVDRLGWSDDEIRVYLAQPTLSLWLIYFAGSPAGFFELQKHEDDSIEIAYFGLLPEFLGRGFGKHLLTRAVEEAWSTGANRVWLHTCTLDDPAALPNYLKRGFKPFKEETYRTIISHDEDLRACVSV